MEQLENRCRFVGAYNTMVYPLPNQSTHVALLRHAIFLIFMKVFQWVEWWSLNGDRPLMKTE